MSSRLPFVSMLGLVFLISGCPSTEDTGEPPKSDPVSDADEDGFTVEDGDCDDADASIHPGAADAWYDGIDSDCAFDSDYDADVDGFDSSAMTDDGEDCDDADDTINPDAEDVFYDGVDANCDGASDFDADGDGHDSADYDGDDCDDTDVAFNPSVDEIWYDGVDQDCDGANDNDADGDGYESLADAGGLDCDDTADDVYPTAPETWYDGIDQDCYPDNDDDADGDGFASSDEGGTDCDDADAAVNTDATESWYDNVDQDCDGGSDFDADGDGYDSIDFSGDDCNDALDSINPGATEVCDSDVDNDCNGTADDADTGLDPASTTTFYADDDADTYGDPSDTIGACVAPSGYVSDNTDCDDTSDLFNPGATEDDCADPNDYNCDNTVGAVDNDNDTYFACEECDDNDANINPAATEVCDGVDNDCDATIDLDATTGAYLGNVYYFDGDFDTYGDAANTTEDCSSTPPTGYVADATDCNDGNPGVNPGAAEECDATDTDEDCDTFADDLDPEGASGTADWYTDADGDGYGDENASAVAYCDEPSTGVSASNDDCDDTSTGAAINPGATDLPQDGSDDDCDDADGNYTADDLIAGELVITEVMANPSGSDSDREWMEVYVDTTLICHASATGACIDLAGLVISDGTTSESFTVGSELLVSDGDYLVFALNDNSTTNGGLPGVDYVLSTGTSVFTNSGDQIDLDNANLTIDSVDYSAASFPAIADGTSLSLEPGTSATDNDNGANWCDSPASSYGAGGSGSPGAANAVCPPPVLACGEGGTCTYATDIHPLWSSNSAGVCTGCHGTQGGLTLSGSASSTLSNELSGLYTAGNSASSRLWQKISGNSGDTRMPKNGGNFTQLDQDKIADWIDQGANP